MLPGTCAPTIQDVCFCNFRHDKPHINSPRGVAGLSRRPARKALRDGFRNYSMTHPAPPTGLIAFSAVSLLGSTNCLIFGLLSWRTYRAHPRGTPHYNAAPWILALFLSLSGGFTAAWYQDSLSYRVVPHLLPLSLSFRFLYGPVIFGFARALLGRPAFSRVRATLHMAPFCLHLASQVPLMRAGGTAQILFWEQGRWLCPLYPLGIILQIFHLLIYLASTLVVIHRSSRRPRLVSPGGGSRRDELSWLGNIVMAVAVVLGLFTLMTGAFILGASPDIILFMRRANEALLFVLIHLLAYQGIRHGTLLLHPKDPGPEPVRPESAPVPSSPAETGRRAPNQTEPPSGGDPHPGSPGPPGAPPDTCSAQAGEPDDRAPLPEAAARELARQADEHIRRTLAFLDPLLSPTDLAQELDVPAHHLSYAINSVLGQRFTHCLNGYRADYARKLLTAPSHRTTPLTEISHMSGFRSKSCFNATFRKCYGCAPSEFRKKSWAPPSPWSTE